MRGLIDVLWSEWKTVEQQIEGLSNQLQQIADSDAGGIRIQKIPGIGPIVATAIVAANGNGAAFRKGREFGAWLGHVPKQYSTGRKTTLLGFNKRGNNYLRKILNPCRFSSVRFLWPESAGQFHIESLELAGQSAYIRSRSWNAKILSTFSAGQRAARNERQDAIRVRRGGNQATPQTAECGNKSKEITRYGK